MTEQDASTIKTIELSGCWAELTIGANTIRQLVVAPGEAFLEKEDDSATWTVNPGGKWRVSNTSDGTPHDELTLVVPAKRKAKAVWANIPPPGDPAEVLDSLEGRFHYREGDLDGTRDGLRSPQLGAVHAVLAYWTTVPSQPATVVMPTGTGKTDTMIAIVAAARPTRVLVIVPTDALRNQIARKFETYGVLPQAKVLDEPVLRLIVGTIEHGFNSAHEAASFAERCNVIVSTVNALNASNPDAREVLLGACTHLFVDEAHHIAASQWSSVRDFFNQRSVVQFTATPFRADGRHLGGRLIFAFPLREAQRQGYYSKIDYVPVTNFLNPDREIAQTAVARLKKDIEAGFDHMLMARVNTTKRADEVIRLYEELAPEFSPVKIHSKVGQRARRAALDAMAGRTTRVIVCVDMLGEGYDLPSLKVAAIHDAHKTLPVTLQFIGRFARVSSEIGDACVVVNRPDPEYDESLRRLYADDAEWNLIIRELAEAAVEGEQEVSDFEAGFGTTLPEEVPIRTLAPKMSTVVYRTACLNWQPELAVVPFGEDNLLTPSVAVNRQKNLAWFVTEERAPVRWGSLKTVEETSYNLYVLYWDSSKNLLYINSSNTDSVYKKLAESVCGDDAQIIKGEAVYRVMAKVNRLVPTNVGLIDVRSRARRFSMHVGADVSEGFPIAEAQTKTKTNIFATGYEDGNRVSFGGSLKGRVWSRRAARSLNEWVHWCDHVGAKIVDPTISIDEVIRGFIRPQEVHGRPSLVVLAVDWPYHIYLDTGEETALRFNGIDFPLHDAELQVDENSDSGPVKFSVVTTAWKAAYEADFTDDGISYRAISGEVLLRTARTEVRLTELFQELGVTFYFEDETTIEHGSFLLRPPRNISPLLREKLTPLTWQGVDFKKESQGAAKEQDSIQYFVIRHVLSERQWDVVLDDDDSGEAADIVALAVDDDGLLIKLIHCKYSSEVDAGARVADLYEVCGQAQKSVRWKRASSLIEHLIRRERNRQSKYSRVGFEAGNEIALRNLQYRVRNLKVRMEIAIAQPGLSASKASDAQLQLLACTEVYLHETAMAKLEVLCSS